MADNLNIAADTMIHCRSLTKRFGDFVAVDAVSFDVASGICALIGPNGAGKSTLLKLLTGLLRPDEGEVRVAGLDVSRHALEVKRAVGIVPEDLGLFDSLTVREHLDLCGPVYGLNIEETRGRSRALLRCLELEDAQDTYATECSHGMRKKTALAMALLHNPRVLFLDEPFEGLDPVASKNIRDLLAAIAGRGIAVFLTSHILSLVDQLATEILLMRDGRIVWTSGSATTSQPLEQVYFDLVEAPPTEELPWLGSSPS